jgi:chromosome segregation ATPase
MSVINFHCEIEPARTLQIGVRSRIHDRRRKTTVTYRTFRELKTGQEELKTDINGVKTDISAVTAGQEGLKSEISAVKNDIENSISAVKGNISAL